MDSPINILFIDDDDNLYIVYKKILNLNIREPFLFDHIGTAEEIEPAILEKKYDIIVLDQKLNNGNKGLDFLPLIRKNNIYTYVIVNSAYGNEDLATEAIRNGANNYIKGNKENNNEFLNVIKQAISIVNQSRVIENLSKNFSNFNQKLENKEDSKFQEIQTKISMFSRAKK